MWPRTVGGCGEFPSALISIVFMILLRQLKRKRKKKMGVGGLGEGNRQELQIHPKTTIKKTCLGNSISEFYEVLVACTGVLNLASRGEAWALAGRSPPQDEMRPRGPAGLGGGAARFACRPRPLSPGPGDRLPSERESCYANVTHTLQI